MVDRVVLRIDIELPRAVGGFRRRTLARDDEVVVAPHAQLLHLQFRDQHFAREHSHEQPFEVRHALFERAVRVREEGQFILVARGVILQFLFERRAVSHQHGRRRGLRVERLTLGVSKHIGAGGGLVPLHRVLRPKSPPHGFVGLLPGGL